MGPVTRPSYRRPDEMRRVSLEPNVLKHAEGSCLVKFGDTHVLCTASIENQAPPFLRGTGRGWVTAEYGMLPRATHERTRREAAAGKQTGRTQEIQRLIGRSGEMVEIQGTGEGVPFSEAEFSSLLALAKKGAAELVLLQKEALKL